MRSFYCLLLILAAVFAFDCPPGYTTQTLVQNEIQVSYCYKVYITFFNRQQAVAKCAEDGATLAPITSPEENQMYVAADQVTGSLTFGLSCYDSGHCVFDDGTPYNSSVYTGFAGGQAQPDLGGCVALETLGVGTGKWSNVPCTMLGAFVCRFKPNTCPNTQTTNTTQGGCNSSHLLQAGSSGITITSPNYPYNYDNFQTCSYFIFASSGNALSITFNDFITETNYDVVRVNNGGYRNNITLIGEYSGPRSNFTVVTLLNEGLITFTTDGSDTARGFSATVRGITR